MKNVISFIFAFIPVAAFAHGPADIYYLMWWHLSLVVFVIGFTAFANFSRKRKIMAVAGLLLFATLAWLTLGHVHSEHNTWQSNALSVALGLAPVVGFLLGLFLGRNKANAI